MKKLIPDLTFILMALSVSTVIAQSQGRIISYSIADGLESEIAQSALQDKYGYIWISHINSISRFDGYQFKNYHHHPDDPLMQLGPQPIERFFLDENGEIWISNSDGYLLKYDYSLDAFEKYAIDIKTSVRSLCMENNDSILWIGTTGDGLIKYNTITKRKTHYTNAIGNDNLKIRADYIYNIHLKKCNLFLFTRFGLWMFDPESESFSRPPLNPSDTSLLYNASLFQSAHRKDYIFQAEAYSLVLDSAYSIKSSFKIPDEYWEPTRAGGQYGLGELDKNGIFWFLNSKGLNSYDPQNKSVLLHSESLGWSNQVLVDRDDNVWMVGWDFGVKKFSKHELNFRKTEVPVKESIGVAVVGPMVGKDENEFSILVEGSQRYDGNLWKSTIKDHTIEFDPLNIDLKNGLGANFSRMSIGAKHVWIGSWFGGVYGFPYNHETGEMQTDKVTTFIHMKDNPYSLLSNGSPVAVEDSNKQVLWVGSYEGLNRIDLNVQYGSDGSVQRFVHDPNNSNSISKGIVRAIHVEEDGSVWVSTDSGLDHLKDGLFTHVLSNRSIYQVKRTRSGDLLAGGDKLYSLERGQTIEAKTFLDCKVSGFVQDLNYNLWFTNDLGLSRFDPRTNSKIDFHNEFGPSLDGPVISPKGTIQISRLPNTLITFDPSTFQLSLNKVKPLLTNILINNTQPIIENRNSIGKNGYAIPKSIATLTELTLDYLYNNFSLEFSAMEMTSPERNLYRHKLEGYDNGWIETDYKNRTATYTNLPAGTYTFRVKASNHHGVWSDKERTLKIIVLPPPWRTWWAYTGYSFLLFGLLFWARSNIVQRERLKANLQLEQIEHEKEHFELEKAIEVDKIKTSFFTNISHEFRTPLTLIKGPVQDMLEQYKEDPKLRERLKLIERNADRLLKLINQLLDLAKLESGTMKIEKSKGDINTFISAVASSFASFAEQKQIRIHIELPSMHYELLFDKDKLETILINLINNAIKFTPSRGSIYVIVEIVNESLLLQVKDTGIGIPEEHQSKIFERFHKVSDTHKEVGTGIGLSLVKELLTILGGTITVKSEPGTGSEFTVVLPIESLTKVEKVFKTKKEIVIGFQFPVASDPQPITGNGQLATESNGEIAKPHILVVEDHNDLRTFIIDCLGDEFIFLEAENGKQGLAVALKENPDIIISDVMMAEMDGITMAKKLKQDVHTSHIPLILLTAKSTEESKLSGLKSGADDYLTKPFNKQELLLKVRNAINLQVKNRERLRGELMSTAPKLGVLSADEKFLDDVKNTILKRLNDEQLSVESLAEEMNMSRVHLYRKVSALSGLTVNELIRKLRLQRAAQLLNQKWGPVSQVAYEVGFSNLSYFSKVFKEEFGVLPSEFHQNGMN